MDSNSIDRIFAPWRLSWVSREDENDHDGDCIFCAYADLEGDDHENRVLARSTHAYTLVNRAPYNPGHVMVIPNKHVGEYVALDDETVTDHALLLRKTMKAIDVAFSPDGFNTGMNLGRGGGASITDHLHAHVVPRWDADTNFMPTTANTKVIVQALDETYEVLHEAFRGLDGIRATGPDDAVIIEE